MRIPTVKVKCRRTGKISVINESDWALGSVPGVSMAGWDRIGEQRGDVDADNAIAAALKQRELVEKQIPKGAALDAKSKSKPNTIKTTAKKSKKTVSKKKTATKKIASKKT